MKYAKYAVVIALVVAFVGGSNSVSAGFFDQVRKHVDPREHARKAQEAARKAAEAARKAAEAVRRKKLALEQAAQREIAKRLRINADKLKAAQQLERKVDAAKAVAIEKSLKVEANTLQDALMVAEQARRKLKSDALRVAAKAAYDAVRAERKARRDALKAAEKTGKDAANTVKKAVGDTIKTYEKAGKDTANAIKKAFADTKDGATAVYKFGVRNLKGIDRSLGDAKERLKNGKVIDALWHLSTDHTRNTEKNAALATQESELVRVAGQIAASAYGGPGGAAAYAAWYTYRATGDMEMALRVGVISGASSIATGAIGDLPSAQIVQKTMLAGAVGGLAVAASGGDMQAIQEGFLKSGGMVMVQHLYEKETTHELDSRASKGKPYCMAAVDLSLPCAPKAEAYKMGPNGKPLIDEDDFPLVDVRKTDPMRPHVGLMEKTNKATLLGEKGPIMVTISKYPGMNAMSVLHDHHSVVLKMDVVTKVVTIVPYTMLTYYGTDAPSQDAIREAAMEKE